MYPRRSVLCVAIAVLTMSACSTPRSGAKNPLFTKLTAPAPTLLSGTIDCSEPVEVAAGGLRVRRHAGMAGEAVRRVDEEMGRIGSTVSALPRSLCRELTSAQAANPHDWSSPSAPAAMVEILSIAAANSLLVPVIGAKLRCNSGTGRWRWGEPSYHDDGGEVDCHESELVFAAYMFSSDGSVLWKAFHRYELERPIDATEAANQLLDSAPVARTEQHLRNQ